MREPKASLPLELKPFIWGLLLSCLCGWSLSCSGSDEVGEEIPVTDWNVILFLLDDLGCDQFGIYDDINLWPTSYLDSRGSETVPGYAPTPFLDELAQGGLRFTRFHAQPSCSPTRASLLTGTYPHVHGIGNPIGEWIDRRVPKEELVVDSVKLRASFETIPELLRESEATRGIGSQCFGKWHLTGQPYDGGLTHPVAEGGFDRYVGCMTNLDRFDSSSYTDWIQVEVERDPDGSPVVVEGPSKTSQHRLEHQVEETISFLQGVEVDERFFAFVSFHTGHSPFDLFDPEIAPLDGVARSSGQPWAAGSRWHPYSREYLNFESEEPASTSKNVVVRRLRAMTSSCDSAMRMIIEQGLSPEVRARTVVLVVGDNGTANHVFDDGFEDPPSGSYPNSHGKRTVYEPGILAPFIVNGPVVPLEREGDVEDGLVDSVDLFGLVLDLFGADWNPTKVDAISPLGLIADGGKGGREYSFSEEFHPNGAPLGPMNGYTKCLRSVQRVDGWKLVLSFKDGVRDEALYHLPSDPLEEHDQLPAAGEEGAARAVYEALSAALRLEFAG